MSIEKEEVERLVKEMDQRWAKFLLSIRDDVIKFVDAVMLIEFDNRFKDLKHYLDELDER